MMISGQYTNSNAAPMAFKLNDKTCETFVSSKPGEPSRPVQHLSNGTTQLGPLPSTSTPVPGVTIDSQGIAHVKPTIKPTTGPGGGGVVGATTPPTQTQGVPPGNPGTTQATIDPTVPPGTTPPTTDPTTAATTDSPTPPAQLTDTPDPADTDDAGPPPSI
jgi:serine/threonine-protein kinase